MKIIELAIDTQIEDIEKALKGYKYIQSYIIKYSKNNRIEEVVRYFTEEIKSPKKKIPKAPKFVKPEKE